MELYTGIDLHANNSYAAIIDKSGKQVQARRVANDPMEILGLLKPYRKTMAGVVVESTFNWYWMIDLLMAEGFSVHLANPSAIQKYKGLKHADDRHDAFWLAEMLRLNNLSPAGTPHQGPAEEERALGETADLAGRQPAKHHQQELRHQGERQ